MLLAMLPLLNLSPNPVQKFMIINQRQKDIVKAQKADLILWNGLNLERWFERFFQ